MTRSQRGGSYEVCDDFLEEFGTFLHLILRPPQLDDVTLLRWVRKIDNHLNAEKIIILRMKWIWIKTNIPRGTGEMKCREG